jgi:hypothetical protein
MSSNKRILVIGQRKTGFVDPVLKIKDQNDEPLLVQNRDVPLIEKYVASLYPDEAVTIEYLCFVNYKSQKPSTDVDYDFEFGADKRRTNAFIKSHSGSMAYDLIILYTVPYFVLNEYYGQLRAVLKDVGFLSFRTSLSTKIIKNNKTYLEIQGSVELNPSTIYAVDYEKILAHFQPVTNALNDVYYVTAY